MKTIVLLLLVATVAYGQDDEQGVPIELRNPTEFIIGGNPAPYDTTRHQILLQRQFRGTWYYICGGSIIGRHTILTAKHCVEVRDDFQATDYRVVVNQYDRATPGEYFGVIDIKKKSESESPIFHQDIALLKTKNELKTEYIIPLANHDDDFTGQTCTITGWGIFDAGGSQTARILQQAEATIMPLQDCKDIWNEFKIPDAFITKHVICVGGGSDSETGYCNGDSGGPLVCGGKLAGVTSWGIRGCDPKYPSMYMSVPKAAGWILTHREKFEE